ncbi:hypothetical protein Tco_0188694 [Tanacetum coccineum]
MIPILSFIYAIKCIFVIYHNSLYEIYLIKIPVSFLDEEQWTMKDQPYQADAHHTALSPGYIANSDPEEDKEDPEEDPADHPADG